MKELGIGKICGITIFSIIGVYNWSILPIGLKILVVLGTIAIALLVLNKLLDIFFAISDFRKICKHIPELERKARRVQMYKHTRGKDFAKELSKKERALCKEDIKNLELLKNEVCIPYGKKVLNQKIAQIENIQNQMVILR